MRPTKADEMARQRNRTDRVLDVLRDGEWTSNATLSNIALRYGACIHALRMEGYRILKHVKKHGIVMYRLAGKEEVRCKKEVRVRLGSFWLDRLEHCAKAVGMSPAVWAAQQLKRAIEAREGGDANKSKVQ